MNIDKLLADEQDIKVVEKIIVKIQDLLHPDEELLYLAVQKKPAVTLLPDSIALSTHRLFFCSPTHLGLTLNIKDISWRNIKEIAFKEEFFGAQFICIPQHGDPIIMEYIPKVQARKLHQQATYQLELFKKITQEREKTLNLNFIEDITDVELVDESNQQSQILDTSITEIENPYQASASQTDNASKSEDETTLKLRKLKFLFDQELISQTEYETKKAEILANF